MRLSDFNAAIQKMIEVCGDHVLFTDISTTLYGDYIFKADFSDWYYLVYHKNHRIVKYRIGSDAVYPEVIYEGDTK